jgi:alpha-L-rhamnosidase
MISNKSGIDMPVMFYWVFHELYRMDTPHTDLEALHEMRRRWKYMVELQQDAGTLSEKFVLADGSGASESCHNYGAMPAWFLSSYVLGVRRDGPVWENKLLIEPRPADLTSAEGVVATEHGPVRVSWRKDEGCLQISCTVPAGTTATLRLPNSGGAVTLDGQTISKPVIQGRHVILHVSSGAHEATVEALPANLQP